MKLFNLAILDLYDNTPNQGMRAIKEIVGEFENELNREIFDVRGAAQVPDLSHDIYISTGGPGSPHDGDGHWDRLYFEWLEAVWEWNLKEENPKKYVLFICHSYQMACKHFRIGKVTKRETKSFGIFPIYLTDEGIDEPVFEHLQNPFWAADFRDFQVVQPDLSRFEEMGASLLALEKINPQRSSERAIMAIRFSPEMLGVQFHPEADPIGMIEHFNNPEEKQQVIDNYGPKKLDEMLKHLYDEDKIKLTHDTVLPTFLRNSIRALKSAMVLL